MIMGKKLQLLRKLEQSKPFIVARSKSLCRTILRLLHQRHSTVASQNANTNQISLRNRLPELNIKSALSNHFRTLKSQKSLHVMKVFNHFRFRKLTSLFKHKQIGVAATLKQLGPSTRMLLKPNSLMASHTMMSKSASI